MEQASDFEKVGWDQAVIDCCELILGIDSNNKEALEIMDRIFYKSHPEKKQDSIEVRKKQLPGQRVIGFEANQEVTLWYNKGVTFLNGRQFKQALECFQKVTNMDPSNIQALILRGNAAQQLGLFQEAGESYDKAIKLNPNNKAVWHSKASLLEVLHWDNEAIKCLDQVIKLDPKDARAYYYKARLLMTQPWEAIKLYEKAIELDPTHADSWAGMANKLSLVRKDEEALKSYQKAIELNPNDEIVWFNFGGLLKSLGKFKEAEEAFAKSKKIKEGVLEKKGSTGYRGAIMFGYNIVSLLYSNFYQQAKYEGIWPKEGDIDGAIKLEESMLERLRNAKDTQGEAIALYNLGKLHYQKNDFQTAINVFEQCFQIVGTWHDIPGVFSVVEYLVDLYIKTENLNKAKEIVESFMERASGVLYNYGSLLPLAATFLLGTVYREEALIKNDSKLLDLALTQFQKGLEKSNSYEKWNPNLSNQEEYRKVLDYRARFLKFLGHGEIVKNNIDQGLKQVLEALRIQTDLDNKYEIVLIEEFIADAYIRMKQFDNALVYIERGLKLAREINYVNEIFNLLFSYIVTYFLKGDYERAIPFIKQVQSLANKHNSSKANVRAIYQLAEAYFKLGRSEEAISAYKENLKLLREQGDIRTEAEIIIKLTDCYRSLRRFWEAKEVLEPFLSKIERDIYSWSGIYYDILVRLGDVYREISLDRNDPNYLDLAIKTNEKGLEILDKIISKQVDDKVRKAERSRILSYIGNNEALRDNLERALKLGLESLKLREEIGGNFEIARIKSGIGFIYLKKGDKKEGLRYLKDGLKLAKEVNDFPDTIVCAGNIGMIYYKEGNLDQALYYIEQSVNAARQAGDIGLLGRELELMAEIQFKKGNLKEATNSLTEVKMIFHKIGNQRGEIAALKNLGMLYQKQGMIEIARTCYQEATMIERDVSMIGACPLCKGSGRTDSTFGKVNCPLCKGKGLL